MATLHVDIVSAEGEIFSGEASMVFAPASQGDVGIAPRHAPLLTNLRPGDLRAARAVWVGNALRGLIPAVLVTP